jgi:hypothetical protein
MSCTLHVDVSGHSDLSQTFYAEVWAEVEDWCKENCQGAYRLDGPFVGWFELASDRDAFLTKWGPHPKAA